MNGIQKLNKILQTLLINPIVEEYDSGYWRVRRWANGEVEMWLHRPNFSISCATPAGSGFVSSSAAHFDFPFTLKEVTFVSAAVVDTAVSIFIARLAYTLSSCNVTLGSFISRSATNREFNVYIKGK